MTTTSPTDVYYDPYDVDIVRRPLPGLPPAAGGSAALLQRQIRLLRGQPVRGRRARPGRPKTYISGRGGILELIKANIEMPPGVLIFEDPPLHTVHRRLAVASVHPQEDERARAADPPVLRSGARPDRGVRPVRLRRRSRAADADAGDRDAARDPRARTKRRCATASTTVCAPSRASRMEFTEGRLADGDMFADYIDWRAAHPSDDIMTELLHVEFEDETGVRRRSDPRGDPDLRQRGGRRR